MRIKILVFSLFIAFQYKAQHWLPIQHDTLKTISIKKHRDSVFKQKQHELISTGIADYSSTSLGKDIAQKFFYGGEISDEMKQKSLKRHNAINRFGSDVQTELEYRNFSVNLFKNENWGFGIKTGLYNFLQCMYSKDFFGFPMFGNAIFAGDTAIFSGSKFSNLTYQKFGFGWIDKKSKSAIYLNVFGLNNRYSIDIEQGEIFQNTDLDSIRIQYNGQATYTKSHNFINGIGVGIDADIRWNSKTLSGKPTFQFLMRNVGFISQTNQGMSYKADTAFSFVGVTYDQIVNGGTFNAENFNILDSLGISKSESKSHFFTPGLLQISKIVDQSESFKNKKFQTFYGARIYLSNMAIPMVFGGLDYNPLSGRIHFGISGSYGGYSFIKDGLYSSLNIQNLNIGLSSENLFSKTGQSIIFRLQCVF